MYLFVLCNLKLLLRPNFSRDILIQFVYSCCCQSYLQNHAVWFVCLQFLAHVCVHIFTYAHDIHEAVHAIADLEEQVLTLPLGRGAEGGPDEPGDAGDEEKGAQNNGRYLHLLYHRQRDGLPLEEEENKSKWVVEE